MTITSNALPAIGTPFEGGFYAGQFNLNGETFGLIVSPKEQGEVNESVWGPRHQDAAGARSYNDGLANTNAMTEAGSNLARWMQALEISGFADWYLPSRDELELIYRNLKPTAEPNWCSFRDGDNPSSTPAGYPYTKESPAQTTVDAFAAGGAEALEPAWYWSSTQCSPTSAWTQDFGGGGQNDLRKLSALRARAVRRFKVTP
jgi:hypothetical protein